MALYCLIANSKLARTAAAVDLSAGTSRSGPALLAAPTVILLGPLRVGRRRPGRSGDTGRPAAGRACSFRSGKNVRSEASAGRRGSGNSDGHGDRTLSPKKKKRKILWKKQIQTTMAGLPASPAFANPAANAIAEFNTPPVAAGAVTATTVCAEAGRKRKIYQAMDNGITSGGIPLVTPAEAGLADLRHAESIALAYGVAVAPPWFAGAMGPIEAQLANMTISRANRRVSYYLKSVERLNF